MVYLSKSVIGFLSPSLYFLLMLHLVQLSAITYSLAYAALANTFWNGGNRIGYITLSIWLVIHMTAMITEIAIADSATEEVWFFSRFFFRIINKNEKLYSCLKCTFGYKFRNHLIPDRRTKLEILFTKH